MKPTYLDDAFQISVQCIDMCEDLFQRLLLALNESVHVFLSTEEYSDFQLPTTRGTAVIIV
jgi:hypothetical protein